MYMTRKDSWTVNWAILWEDHTWYDEDFTVMAESSEVAVEMTRPMATERSNIGSVIKFGAWLSSELIEEEDEYDYQESDGT
jgi:hypothetical protein